MMIVTSVVNIVFNVNSAGVHKRTVLTLNISRVYRGFVHRVVKGGRMIDSDKTKGSAIADSNSVRGMTDLHSCILSKCEKEIVLQKKGKTCVAKEINEIREVTGSGNEKRKSRLSLLNFVFSS